MNRRTTNRRRMVVGALIADAALFYAPAARAIERHGIGAVQSWTIPALVFGLAGILFWSGFRSSSGPVMRTAMYVYPPLFAAVLSYMAVHGIGVDTVSSVIVSISQAIMWLIVPAWLFITAPARISGGAA